MRTTKTFIGRISRGFDFLGFAFSAEGFGIAEKTVVNFKERVARLYEQGADFVRIGQYAKRWFSWVNAGVELDGQVGRERGPLVLGGGEVISSGVFGITLNFVYILLPVVTFLFIVY